MAEIMHTRPKLLPLIALAAEESRLNGGKAINMNEWRTKK